MPGELTYSIAGPGNQRFSIYLTDAATIANPARMYALFN